MSPNTVRVFSNINNSQAITSKMAAKYLDQVLGQRSGQYHHHQSICCIFLQRIEFPWIESWWNYCRFFVHARHLRLSYYPSFGLSAVIKLGCHMSDKHFDIRFIVSLLSLMILNHGLPMGLVCGILLSDELCVIEIWT